MPKSSLAGMGTQKLPSAKLPKPTIVFNAKPPKPKGTITMTPKPIRKILLNTVASNTPKGNWKKVA